MSKIEVDAIEPQSGTTLTIGASGDTITIPSGATLTNSGTATGFGKVLQVVENTTTSTVSASVAGYTDTGLSVSITPSSTSNKILVLVFQPVFASRGDNESDIILKVQSNHSGSYTDITLVVDSAKFIQTFQSGSFASTENGAVYSCSKLFSPNTTSSFTVKTVMRMRSAYGASGTVTAQNGGNESSMQLIEIAG
jgi:hypothetical protein